MSGSGIEAAICAKLQKRINVRTKLRIEERRKSGIEKRVSAGSDIAGSRLREDVTLEFQCSTDARANVSLRIAEGQRFLKSLKKHVGPASQRDQHKSN